MGLFDRKEGKPAKKNPAERQMRAGAREYEAQRHDRNAARLEAAGDQAGAAAERAAAADLREPGRRR
jgi:hypothetical protein